MLSPCVALRRVALPRRMVRAMGAWACVETPNPKVRKFEPLATNPGGSGSYTDLPAARSQILAMQGVKDVFSTGSPGINGSSSSDSLPWLAVTRADGADWETLAPSVQALLEALPEVNGINANIADAGAHPVATDAASSATADVDSSTSAIMADIEECLEARVRPGVQADGGDVELVSFDGESGEVVLRLQGACRGCPQSAVTLKETILRALQYFIPEVRSVVQEEDTFEMPDGTDPTADIPWEHNGQPEAATMQELAAAGTPFFSTFAGFKAQGPKLRRVRFVSRLELAGRRPEHIFVSCVDCKARRTIEDPQDILSEEKGNFTQKAAVVICPTCAVLISR